LNQNVIMQKTTGKIREVTMRLILTGLGKEECGSSKNWDSKLNLFSLSPRIADSMCERLVFLLAGLSIICLEWLKNQKEQSS